MISAQYGTTEGLVAAAAATAALLLGNFPDRSINQDIYDNILAIAQLPLMWAASAVVLGELRERHIRERDQLKEDLVGALSREEQITNSYERLNVDTAGNGRRGHEHCID